VPEEWLKHLEEIDAPQALPAKAAARENGAAGASEELPAPPGPRPNVDAEPIPSPDGDDGAEAEAIPLDRLRLPGAAAAKATAAAARIADGWRPRKAGSEGKRID
jgi:hypothetical protein